MMFDPFALTGPEFLRFYVFCLSMVILYGLVRRGLYIAGQGSGPNIQWSPYELACLAGGHKRVAEVSVAELLRKQTLVLGQDNDTLSLNKDLPDTAEPTEHAAHAAVAAGQSGLQSLRNSFISPPEVVARLLTHCMVTNAALRPEPLACMQFGVLPLRLLAGFGAVRLVLGILSGRPIGFLFALCVGTLVLSFFWGGKPDHKTSRGQRLLADKMKRNAALRTTATRRGDTLSHNDFVLAAGLFGVPLVMTGEFAWMKALFAPPRTSPNLSGSDSGNGCGSGSSCSGGSSCGGGGCGGCGG